MWSTKGNRASVQVVRITEPLGAEAIGNVRVGVCVTLDPILGQDQKN